MRLLTFSALSCHAKKCQQTQLHLSEIEIIKHPTAYNPEFIANFVNSIDVDQLNGALMSLGIEQLPPFETDDAVVRKYHEALLECDVRSGQMVCSGCGHVYAIQDGIPNMLLDPSEL